MTRVLILEPDLWRHRGLASVLRDAGEFDVSPETDYGRILAMTSPPPDEMHCDVIGLAHRLVLEYGVAIIAMLRDLFDPCAIVVHGEIDSIDVAAQVFAAGARGYFVLSHPPGVYPKAVAVVAKGKFWGPREAVGLMAERVIQERPTEENGTGVGDEDLQILRFLQEGLANKEIGQRLGLAEATIKARLNRLYKRFNVATRLQLLSAAIKEGLV